MSKILVVGSQFRTYNESLCCDLKRLGHDVKIVATPMLGIKRNHIFTRVKRKLGFDINEYYEKMRNSVSHNVVKEFIDFKPDIVCVRLGNMLIKSDVEFMARKAKLILNLSDPLARVPEIVDSLPLYSHIYTYELTDVVELQKYISKPIDSLFGCYSDLEYYPIPCEKDIDVYFVGAMYTFRTEILIRLINDFPDLNIVVDGEYSSFKESRKMIAKSDKNIQKCFSNRLVTPKDINQKYNRSKICLNLQHQQTKNGWNSRLVEILGSRAFEIVTANPSVNTEFKGALLTYESYEELRNNIEYYLNHEDERNLIAKQGYQTAVKKYTNIINYKKIINNENQGCLNEHI